jgi:hypothetical protein
LHAINEGKLPKLADGGPVSKPITLPSDVKTSAGQAAAVHRTCISTRQ